MNKPATTKESGFTLLEIIIAVGLTAGLVLIFAQVVNNYLKSTKHIEQSSLLEKRMSALLLELRSSDFGAIKDVMLNSSAAGYKCDTTTPSDPTNVERFLYTWRELDHALEFCMDVDSYEYKLGGNLVDIKFRSVVRKIGTTQIIPLDTKFINLRKGR